MATALVGSESDSSSLGSHLTAVTFANATSLSPKPSTESLHSLLDTEIDAKSDENNEESSKIEAKSLELGQSSNNEPISPTNDYCGESTETENAEDDEVFKKLQSDYERRKEERKKEQDKAALERERLDEILRLCCEYDVQAQRLDREAEARQRPSAADEKRDSRSSWGSGTKIKTNGSLTSLVTCNRRSDDVGTSVPTSSYAKISEIKSDARSQSQKSEANLDRTGIMNIHSSTFSDKPEFPVNITSNQFDRNNRYQPLQANISTLSDGDRITKDSFRNEYHSMASHHPTEMSFKGDSALSNGSLKKANRMMLDEEAIREHQRYFSDTKSYGNPYENPSGKSNDLRFDQFSNENRQKRSAEDTKQRINVLLLRILDVKDLEEKTISETQSELELLQWEYNALMEQLQREKDRIAAINHQQMELLLEAAKEREEAESQLESERCRLEELEKHLEETRKRCVTLGTEPSDDVTLSRSALGDLVFKAAEEVDQQRRFFDDLEFNLLELETRREEEREPQQRKLASELDQLKHSCNLIEETLQHLSEQKSNLVRQLKSDVVDLERERILLIEDFRKEKQRLYYLLKENLHRLNNHPVGSRVSPKHVGNMSDLKAFESFTSDDELFPTTPSSTISVIQRLQELQMQTVNGAPAVSSSRDCCFETETGDQDSLKTPDSSASFDHVQCWFSAGVAQRHDNPGNNGNSRPTRFLSGSDEDGSILSSDDRFDENSFGTNGSQVLQSYEHGDLPTNDSDSSPVGRYSIRSAQSATEVSTFSFTVAGDWTKEESVSQDYKSPESVKVVMRQSHKAQTRPMTRYLPVRGSCDLDLRQFIESSGHRIDGNAHVQVTSSTCRGFLVKLGRRFRLWHRRWFVFDRSRHSITYYSDQTEKRVRGCILFGSIEDVFVDHLRKVRSPSPKLTFCLKTNAKTLFLLAPSPEAMRIWIDVLFTGAEGYQEFS